MTTATLTLILLLSGRVFMPNRLRRFDFKSKPFETWLQSPKRQGRKTMTNGAIFLKEIGSFRIHFFPVRKCIFLKKVKSKCKAIIMTISSLTENKNVRSKIILRGPNRFCKSFNVSWYQGPRSLRKCAGAKGGYYFLGCFFIAFFGDLEKFPM